jgi:hypothetical protein
MIHRRDLVKTIGAGGALNLAGLFGERMSADPSPQESAARRGLPPLKITDVRTFLTAPNGIHI